MTTNTVTTDKKAKGLPYLKNKNATKHGLRASGLPKGCSYIEGQVSAFRRYVREQLGEMTLWQEATLQSACRHETRALLAARWLRLEGEALTVHERVALSKTISDATTSRDKALRGIGLDVPPDPIDLKTYIVEGNGE